MAPLESCSPNILVAMERLWFHKIVLCSEPNLCPNKTPTVEFMTPSFSSSSSSSSSSDQSLQTSSEPTDYSDDDDDDIIQDFSFAVHGSLPTILPTHQQMDSDDERKRLESEDDIKELIPKRPSLVMKRAKTSMTPNRRRIKSTRLRLERTASCKTLEELEQEEVKGFMDLGFIFNKERITPRMMSVLPGLQRLQGEDKEECFDAKKDVEEDMMKMVSGDKGELAKKKPYLSEAWLIKRPDSPLVRLRMSRPSTTSTDMKVHLKMWAKSVASSAIRGS